MAPAHLEQYPLSLLDFVRECPRMLTTESAEVSESGAVSVSSCFFFRRFMRRSTSFFFASSSRGSFVRSFWSSIASFRVERCGAGFSN